jgi:GT2 family glycosyltransferase
VTLPIDIIVPVWNRPLETRNCLVSLIQNTDGARFILVDNGSDRETENMLEEFAERLDERALLLRTECNQGYIKAANKGLSRAEARLMAIVRPTSLVSAGWLEPLIDLADSKTEAGIIVPRLLESGKKSALARPASGVTEVSRGSLAAMLIKRELYDRIGGLDEDMDGDTWCIADYSRQAHREGYLTFAVAGGVVTYSVEQQLGSTERRQELIARSRQRFLEKWGESASYCIYLPKESDPGRITSELKVVLEGARQGHRFTLVGPGAICRQLVKYGALPMHELIELHALPLFGANGALRRTMERLRMSEEKTMPVTAIDGIPFPGEPSALSFAQMERAILREPVAERSAAAASSPNERGCHG